MIQGRNLGGLNSDQFDEFMDLQNYDNVKPIHAARDQRMWMDPQVSQKYEKLAQN